MCRYPSDGRKLSAAESLPADRIWSAFEGWIVVDQMGEQRLTPSVLCALLTGAYP